jgi:hypothetical protein
MGQVAKAQTKSILSWKLKQPLKYLIIAAKLS